MTVIWMILFAVLVVIELNTLEFTCLNIAMGCLLAATAAWIGLALAWQMSIAAVVSVVGVMLIAPAMRKRLLPADMRTGNDLMVGAEAEVIEAILPPSEGKVKINGVTWQAVSDRQIPLGKRVYVTELQGAKLVVIARDELEEPHTQVVPTHHVATEATEDHVRPESLRDTQ